MAHDFRDFSLWSAGCRADHYSRRFRRSEAAHFMATGRQSRGKARAKSRKGTLLVAHLLHLAARQQHSQPLTPCSDSLTSTLIHPMAQSPLQESLSPVRLTSSISRCTNIHKYILHKTYGYQIFSNNSDIRRK